MAMSKELEYSDNEQKTGIAKYSEQNVCYEYFDFVAPIFYYVELRLKYNIASDTKTTIYSFLDVDNKFKNCMSIPPE